MFVIFSVVILLCLANHIFLNKSVLKFSEFSTFLEGLKMFYLKKKCLQVNSSGCCSLAQCVHGIPASTSKRPSSAKSSWLRTRQRTLTMVSCPTTSCWIQPSPEPSPWLQLWEIPSRYVLLGVAGKYSLINIFILLVTNNFVSIHQHSAF